MQWTSIIAVYFLFWIMTAFLMLPFGVKTADEVGAEKIPGQADSAPVSFRPGRLAIRATVLAAIVTTLWVLNYERGWITVDDIDFFPKRPEQAA